MHVSAHTLHYRTGVFEGIRSYETPDGPAIFRPDAHLDRLFDSAEAYGVRIAFTEDELSEAICEVVRQNQFRSCYIRPICYSGSQSLGLLPDSCPVHVSVIAWPLGATDGNRALEEGVKVEISRSVKFHSSMMSTTAKGCGQYLNSILGLREATRKGYDESVLLNLNGTISGGRAKISSSLRAAGSRPMMNSTRS